MGSSRRVRRFAVAMSISVLGAVALASSAKAVTFSNSTLITSPATSVANPYPSPIAVAGLTGTVTKVRATLFGISGTGVNRMQVLLVGPAGQSTVLMRSTCGDVLAGEVFTFDDAASSLLPAGSCAGQSGTYQPTDRDPADNSFAAPAPPTPYGATLSVFNGSDPNGLWRLFVEDDINGGIDLRTIGGGWSLDVEVTPPAPVVTPQKKKCKKGKRLKKVKGKKKCVKKKKNKK